MSFISCGGAAGGGKSWSILFEPLRHVDNPHFNCVIFRRTMAQVMNSGSIWDASFGIYNLYPGARAVKTPRPNWRFPSGANIMFAHMQDESTKMDYQGAEICLLCCEENSLVRMADGTTKKIKDLKCGDEVSTLEGKNKVIAIGNPEEKECVLVEFSDGTTQIQSTDHAILTKAGWISYDDIIHLHEDSGKRVLLPTECRFVCKCAESKKSKGGLFLSHRSKKPLYFPQENESVQQEQDHQSVSDQNERTCYVLHRFSSFLSNVFDGGQAFWKLSNKNSQDPKMHHEDRFCHRKQGCEDGRLILDYREKSGTYAYKALPNPGSCFGWFVDALQVIWKHISIHLLQGRFSPFHKRILDGSVHGLVFGEEPGVQNEKVPEGLTDRCWMDSNLCGEQSQMEVEISQGSVLRLNDAVVRVPTHSHKDDSDRTRICNYRVLQYVHPYTGKESESRLRNCNFASAMITPYGKATVIPVTIESCNHYITESGIVNKNCFDELTHFTEGQFWYMLSRNRSTCGVKPYIRATCNPDPDSFVAKLISWWWDPETGYAIPERSGVIRYFARVNEELVWGDTKEEILEKPGVMETFDAMKKTFEKDGIQFGIDNYILSFTFIASSIYDNKELLRQNPMYLTNLQALGLVERERLLKGNWLIRPAAGLMFKRIQVNVVDEIPEDVSRWVRGWDLAATEKDENGEAAFTAGVLIGKRKNGKYIVADVVNKQYSADEVRKLIHNTAVTDKKRFKHKVKVRLPQDPGQAGKDQAANFIKMLAGFSVVVERESGDKVTRAEPFAAQWQAGNVEILAGDWNDMYFNQLEGFPDGKWKDMVDASSSAFAELEKANISSGPPKESGNVKTSYWR